MRYLKDYKTNRKVRVLHNVKAAQSRQEWKQPEVFKAIADAKAGIAHEICAECGKWTHLDCKRNQNQ